MKKIALATAILIASAGAFAQGAKNEAPAAPAAESGKDTGRHEHHKKEHGKKHHAEGKAADAKAATPAAAPAPAPTK